MRSVASNKLLFLDNSINTFNTEFEKLLSDHDIKPGSTFLLACSGGLDSVTLFHLIRQQKMPFAVAHVNFRLRGPESDGDESFVKELCKNHKIKCHTTSFETSQEATSRGLSIQMAARGLRYEWFKTLLKQHKYTYLLTAHHSDDNIETALINLTRGSGIEGLSGMSEFDGSILRPLLQFSRKQILKYAIDNKLEWREDSSNAETDYLRNAIRHQLIPQLTDINPAFNQIMQRNLNVWKEQSTLFNKHCSLLLRKYVVKQGSKESMLIKRLQSLKQKSTLLHYWLAPHKFNSDQMEQMIDAMEHTHETKIFVSPTHRLVKTHRELVLQSLTDNTDVIVISHGSGNYRYADYEIVLSTIKNSHDINLKNKHYHYLCADKIVFPLILRPFIKGDYFYPFGVNKKKKVSDYYTNNKFTLIEKEQTPLISMQDKILCIVGHTIDHRFQVTTSTKGVLRVLLKKRL